MERIDDLQCNGLTLEQDDALYTFTGDAVLLADFARLRAGEEVCDFGTGAGIIPVLLAGKCPDITVTGIEIQEPLCRLALRNSVRNGLSGRVRVLRGDWREADRLLAGGPPPGLIVCNPPYFRRGSGNPGENPCRARARHELDGTLSDLCRSASRVLKHGGRFCLCYTAERLAELFFALKSARLEPKVLRAVAVSIGAAPHLFLIEAVKDGRGGLRHLPPLFLREEEGESAEIIEIYHRNGKEAEK